MKSWKDNISFILIEPKEPGNIGASARAMKNMGFQNLELVKPCRFLTDEARCMACGAGDILEKAEIRPGFRDALKDKSLVVGTTRRLGRRRGLIIPLRGGVKRIVTAAKKNRVGILFGRERNGLTNQEAEKCGFLITIPAEPLSPSLNLAQSVMLIAYELSRKPQKAASPAAVEYEERENLYRHIQETLRLLEFIPRGERDLEAKIMRNLRHLLGRAGLTDWELKMLHGICTQVEKRIAGFPKKEKRF